MKKILLLLVIVGAVLFLLNASGDVRSVVGWAATGYLLLRALPAVRHDFAAVGRLVSSRRRFSLRRSKVDTL